ncbi:MAG: KH domain-containing protein [Chthoniobacter sp.]|uniref:KH domain-containing protein n=1 Tax=Chthoniobacter sp. TaxID=2510640 RepID=UPI0032A1AB14
MDSLQAMQEFLEHVLPLLIDYPEEMVLTKQTSGKRTTFHLKVRQTDVGKVIGKHGQTIVAIRNLLAASAARPGEKAQLEIVE